MSGSTAAEARQAAREAGERGENRAGGGEDGRGCGGEERIDHVTFHLATGAGDNLAGFAAGAHAACRAVAGDGEADVYYLAGGAAGCTGPIAARGTVGGTAVVPAGAHTTLVCTRPRRFWRE